MTIVLEGALPFLGREPLPALEDPERNDSLGDQEPEARRERARERGHDVDSGAVRDWNRQRREGVAEQHEEGIARWMRDAEDFYGGHVLARVPHRDRRCEGQ